jgi:membrane protein
MSRFGEVKADATTRWKRARLEHNWLDHLVRAWGRFQDNNASQYAAAITYFSFLALFPLLLLAASVMGFVLSSNPHLEHELIDKIAKNIPGTLGDQLSQGVQSVISSRTGVGLIGLFGVLLTGLGWIGNLRQAINGVWGLKASKQSFVRSRAANLLVLAGLGLGILLSLGLATVGTAVTDQIVRAAGLESVSGISYLVKAAAIVIGLLGDLVIFGWLLIRLPRAEVSSRIAFRTALLAAVGFEVLKIVGTYTISKSAHSATLGPFAGLLAVLIWIQLVARYLLFCTAWSATATATPALTATPTATAAPTAIDRPAASLPPIELPARTDVEHAPAVSRWGVAASLFGAGAATGAGLVSYLRRDRTR